MPVFLLEFFIFRRSFADLVAEIIENFCRIFAARDVRNIVFRGSYLLFGFRVAFNEVDDGGSLSEVGTIVWEFFPSVLLAVGADNANLVLEELGFYVYGLDGAPFGIKVFVGD